MDDNERIDIVPMIQHRLLWDILPCDQVPEYWGAMKLVPPGPDVSKAAHTESHARLRRVAPLQNVCEMYVVLTADIITEVMYKQMLTNVDPEDAHMMEMAEQAHTNMQAQNREVVRGSLYATLAHLVEGGFIAITQPQGVTR